MSSRAFLFILFAFSALVIVTSPPVLPALVRAAQVGALVEAQVTATTTPVPPTFTPTATATRDPFGDLPTATPWGRGAQGVLQGGDALAFSLPAPSQGELPPTFTPGPARTSQILSSATSATPGPLSETVDIPVPPTPDGTPPDRVIIPRLGLDAPVEPVGMAPSDVAPGVVEWEVPDHRAAGWLNTSAAFGEAGNTVLDGHHNIKGEVFRDLWTLQAGDEIVLYAGSQARRYIVRDVLILPEKGQPIEVRLANARYLLPTDDERLTLVTCWPYENNTHRTVVMAFPQEVPHETS
jgi:sortase A